MTVALRMKKHGQKSKLSRPHFSHSQSLIAQIAVFSVLAITSFCWSFDNSTKYAE